MAAPLRLLADRVRGLQVAAGITYRFRGELYPHRAKLLGALLASVGYTAARIAEPWPLKFIFDNVLSGMPLNTPIPWVNQVLGTDRMLILIAATLAILGLALVRGVFYYYQSLLTSVVGQEIAMQLRRRLFAHLQRLSLSFHARSRKGDLLHRLTGDIGSLRELLVSSLSTMLSEGVVVVGYLVVMFLMEWRLALLAVLVLPVLMGFLSLYSGRIQEATREQRKREGQLASRIHEALNAIHIVQMFAREEEEEARLGSLNKRSLKSGLKAARLEVQLNRSVELSLAVATAATLILGATQVIAGRLTPGELIVFVSYMQGFYRPLRRISRVAQRSSKATSSLERITDVLDEAPDVTDGRVVAPRFRGEIRLERVQFSYVAETPVLRDVNLTIRAGETVALVGPTGAGKTTLLGLIPRLYDPIEGAVRIDGHDLREFTHKSLRDQISVVPQDGMLFGADFRENIAYGKPDATDTELEAAARAARIHEFIVAQPHGYGTVIGERGVTLSGGQRQRLAIARALVKDAPVVLLDEPTTGLDAESEQVVLEALDRLLAGRTALVIAHRLATIRRADCILFMEHGRIVERGTHEALLALAGRYRDFYALQFAAGEREASAQVLVGP